MKKILVVVMLFCLGASLVFGGGRQGTGSPSGGSPAGTQVSARRSSIPAAFSDLDQSFPLAEKVTFKVMRPNFTDVHPASSDLWMWKRYEELTNVHIEWEDVPTGNWTERRNLVMASNDLPDMFYQANFSMDEVATYGAGGSFIRLNELIERNNSHLKAVMEKWPVVKRAMTLPDGNIYSLPYIQPDPLDASVKYCINKNWLQRLGLAVPKTVNELTEVLRQFKTKDANGNGNPDDEFPWSDISGTGTWTLESQLLGSFGAGNKGNQAINMGIDLGPEGKVRFIPTTEAQRGIWRLLASWYREGIIDEAYFSGVDQAQWVTYGEQDRVGAFSWASPSLIGGQTQHNFAAIIVLTGPQGDKIFSWCEPPVRGAATYMITPVCKDPDLAMKWVDFFYCDQGTIFGTFGEEGLTYNRDASGNIVYIDSILNSKDGSQVAAFQWVDNVYGGYYPYLDIDVTRLMIGRKSTVADVYKTTEDINQYIPADGYWATFASTPDEAGELAMLWTDLAGYRDEMRPKFVTGELSLDRDWDNYVATMNRMGVDRYLRIRQAQLDRILAQNR
jgi:putative aldouronate transport system substrate-binding protein